MDNRVKNLFDAENIFFNNMYGHYYLHSLYDIILIFSIIIILIFFSLINKINLTRIFVLMFHFFSFWFFIGFLIDMNSYPDMGFFYESLFEIRSGYTSCIGEGYEIITQGQKSTCFISFLPFLNSSLSSFALMNLLVLFIILLFICFRLFYKIF